MPKRIVILDPNGVEVAYRLACKRKQNDVWRSEREIWALAVDHACTELRTQIKRQNPKLGTYTVTVKEVE